MRVFFTVLVLNCLLLPSGMWAQPREVPALFHTGELQLSSEKELLSNTLVLFNQTPEEQTFIPLARPEGWRIFNLPDSIVVPPFGSVSLPVKFLPLSRSLHPASGEWSLSFSGSNGDTIKASFRVTAEAVRQVTLQAANGAIPVAGPDNSYTAFLRIINRGNTQERVTLHLAPGRFRLARQRYDYLLPPFSDTLLQVRLEEDRHALQYDAAAPLQFSLTDSIRQGLASLTFSSPGLTGNDHSRQRLHPDNFLLLQAGGIGTTYRFNEALLSYNPYGQDEGLMLVADVVDQVADRKRMIRNSYLGYRSGKLSTRVGTINRYALVPLSGQGAEVILGDEVSQAGVVYIHTPNTYLYNDGLVEEGRQRSLSGFMQTPLGRKTQGSARFVQQWETSGSMRNSIAAAGIATGGEKGRIRLDAAFSNSRARNSDIRNGWMGTLQARYRKGRWEADATDLYADGGFSGLQQNTIQLQNSLTWYCSQDEEHSISIYQSDLRNGRRYDNFSGLFFDSRFDNAQYGVSYRWQRPSLQAQLSPYFSRQLYGGMGNVYSLRSLRSSLSLLYQQRRWRADLRVDYAWLQEEEGRRRAARPVRLQSVLQYHCVSLQALYQEGNYFVTDLPLQALSGQSPRFLNIGPGVRISGWRQKLDVFAGYNLQLDRRYDYPLHYVQAGALLRVTPFVDFRTEWYYYHNNKAVNSDLRFSLQFFFGKPAAWRSRSRKLLLFDDANLNGAWDAKERRLENIVVQYNNRTLRSDRQGMVRWKENAAPERLSIAGNTGYALLPPDTGWHQEKQVIAVPLYRLGVLKGSVSVVVPRYFHTPVNAEGVEVVLVAASGKKYSSTIRSGGKLEAWVPAGTYELRIAPQAGETFALKKPVQVTIVADEAQQLSLELTYRPAREVEIRKFGEEK